MKLNKSPGNDGLSVEFYLKFWPVIGDLVLASFNEAFKHGELSTCQRQAVITLIHKKKTKIQTLLRITDRFLC